MVSLDGKQWPGPRFLELSSIGSILPLTWHTFKCSTREAETGACYELEASLGYGVRFYLKSTRQDNRRTIFHSYMSNETVPTTRIL